MLKLVQEINLPILFQRYPHPIVFREISEIVELHTRGGSKSARPPPCTGRFRMLSTDQLIKIDPSLADLDKAELEHLRTEMYEMAQLAFDVYQIKKGGSKNPVGLLPVAQEGHTI